LSQTTDIWLNVPDNWLANLRLTSVLSWAIIVVALFIVPRNRKPGAATAWLMLIVLQPYLGALLFLLIGTPKLSRQRRAQQRRADALIAARLAEARADAELERFFDPPLPERYEPFVRLNASLGGMPACTGNRVELFAGYDVPMGRMIAAVDQAHSFVHAEFYILALDQTTEPFFVALENAVRRGVAVRLLADHLASRGFRRRQEMSRRLTAAGVNWHWSLPLKPHLNQWNRPDLRNHRKLLVVDGRCAFTGSLNMIDSSYLRKRNLERGQRYVEVVAATAGPVALEVNAVFLTDWFSEGGAPFDTNAPSASSLMPGWAGSALCQILPSGPGYDNDNNLKLFTSLIHAARHTLVITTPYFVPDDSLMTALTSAAQRGVQVVLQSSSVSNQVIVVHAQHSYYEELLRAGVTILLLKPPELLHAKHMSIDDDIAVIGSSNLDMRSFTLNLEITLVAYDQAVVSALRDVEASFRARSEELRAEQWSRHPWPGKLIDNLARLTASLQ
jgi:cardiolipin synthase A/B